MDNETRYRLGREIYETLLPFEEPFDSDLTPENQDKARNVLINFFSRLKEIEPNPHPYARAYSLNPYTYYSYIDGVLDFKKRLEYNDYVNACDKLLQLFLREDILQQRIYIAVMRAWEQYEKKVTK